MTNHEAKTYVVLGMHRSATSFIARLLHKAGVNMGDPQKLMGGNSFNPEGHFENAQFIIVNDAIIQEAGGAWDRVPSEETIEEASKNNQDRVKQIVEDNKGKSWGWKDPRTCLTLDAYLPYLDGDTYLICCFRKPQKVAESLENRNRFPVDKGVQLAKEYNRRLIKSVQKFLEL